MQSDELDDLFRQQLDGHASLPGTDLWARLQARTGAEAAGTPGLPPAANADADPLDAQFRTGLAGHATPPRRELWEQLEDEYLRPRQRRRPVVAWGRLAVAASLLLLLLAGGAGLWWRGLGSATGGLATQPAAPNQPASRQPAANPAPTRQPADQATAALAPAARSGTAGPAGLPVAAWGQAGTATPGRDRSLAVALAAATGRREKKEDFFAPRATASPAPASSSPVASTAQARRAASGRRLPQADSQLDATGRSLARHQEQPAADSPAAPSPTLAAALTSTLAEPQVIEVEVRHGGQAPRPAPAVAAATPDPADETPARPRLRLGGVLRQAGRALRGEPVSLTDAATNLPDSLTVRARLGGRLLSKTIQF